MSARQPKPAPLSTVTRREVLVGGTALALAGCASGPRTIDPQPIDHAVRTEFAPDAVPLSRTLFPQTVAAGAMRTDAARLWTRAEGLGSITLRVWRELSDSQTAVALVTERAVDVPAHGNVQQQVTGLAPATWYRYAFFAPDFSARSPIGRVRTALPEDWDEPVTIGATSCAKATFAPFTSLSLMSQQQLDCWLHLGDVSYNDEAMGLEGYRAMYRTALADPGYRDLFEAAGAYLTWDDHDFFNNFDPEKLADQGRIADAKTAWFESLPVEQDAGRLWRSYRWGKTVEIFLLDCRTERLPSTREQPDAQYLSRAQLDWLKAGLRDSPCHFKLVMNSVPITNMPPPLWGGQADRWQGYPAARDELLDFLTANDLRNVWFVSGDFHVGLVGRVEKDGPRSRYLEVAAGPAAHVNPLSLVFEPGQEANREIAFPSKQFLFASGGFNSTVLTFDPKADTVRIVFKDASTNTTTLDREFTFGA